MIARQRERSLGTYGYRRMWLWLKSQNICRNPKTVLRIMKKYDLLSDIRRQTKWRQMGQRLHKYKNLLNREHRQAKQQMGHGHLVHPHQARCAVPVYDP
ncbi:MAG TPA: IS3 family transposase [Firmicutes bacterium]|nr:IS3 family transposase [Bacillota bacterium]